jgi:aminoglycoside 6'-N-acetyltransferase
MEGVTFRPLAETDLPAVAGWLRPGHVRRWWRQPDDEDAVRSTYLPRIRGLDPTEVFVIVLDGRDVGLIQRYRLDDHPQWADAVAPAAGAPGSSAGIDYLIGAPDVVGRGRGAEAVARFTELVFAAFADVDRIVVTPQVANLASCRVLEKSGYVRAWTGMLASDHPSDAGERRCTSSSGPPAEADRQAELVVDPGASRRGAWSRGSGSCRVRVQHRPPARRRDLHPATRPRPTPRAGPCARQQ